MFYDNFIKICAQQKKKPRQVLMEAGLSKNSIDNYKRNGSTPQFDNLMAIANILDVSPDELTQNNNSYSDDDIKWLNKYKKLNEINKTQIQLSMQQMIATQEHISLPLFDDKVSAGCGYDLYNNGNYRIVDVVNTSEAQKADFILLVTGDSMLPKYEDGDYVLVKQMPSIAIGQIGIFQDNNSDCKGFIKKLGRTELISLNPEYDNIPLSETIECKGLVVGKATLSVE